MRRASSLYSAVLVTSVAMLVLAGCGGGGSGPRGEDGLLQTQAANPFAGRYCGTATQNGSMAMVVVVRVLTNGVAQVAVYGPKLDFLYRASGTVSALGAASWTVAAKDTVGAAATIKFAGTFTGGGATLAGAGTWTGYASGTRKWQVSVIKDQSKIANHGSWNFTFPSTGGGGTYSYTQAFGVLTKYQGVTVAVLFFKGPSTFAGTAVLEPADAVIVVPDPGKAVIGSPYGVGPVNLLLSKWKLDWYRSYRASEAGAASTVTFSAKPLRSGGTTSGTLHSNMKSLGNAPPIRCNDVAFRSVRIIRDYR